MGIKTVDIDDLAEQAGNLYRAISIIGKRARQISSKTRNELADKLAYYEGFDREVDDARLQEDQAKVSLQYEIKEKPTVLAIDEMFEHEIFYRDQEEKTDEL